MYTKPVLARYSMIAITLLLLPLICTASGRKATKVSSHAITKANSPSQQETQIRAVLEYQRKAWNEGDLEKFMSGYWHSPKLTFFGNSRQNGWEETLEHYRKTYKTEGSEMGKLVFSEIEIQTFSKDSAFVRGQWELTMSGGKKPHGLFTLIFRRFNEGWKIIHDHSSLSQ